jgi:hypothetical protein
VAPAPGSGMMPSVSFGFVMSSAWVTAATRRRPEGGSRASAAGYRA